MTNPLRKKYTHLHSIKYPKKQFIDLVRVKNELDSELEHIFGKQEYEKFKAFAFQKRTFQQRIGDLIIGFTLGAACKSLAEGISEWIFMPIVSYCVNQTGTDWKAFEWSPVEGLVFKIGEVLNLTLEFFLIALILYIGFYKVIHPIFSSDDKEVIESDEVDLDIEAVHCGQCLSQINPEAKRCPHCTSWLSLPENELINE